MTIAETVLRDLRRVADEYKSLCSELRAQLTAKNAECVEAVRRGDEMMDKLLAYAGHGGVTAAGRAAVAHQREADTQFLRKLDDDDFSEVSFNHPESRFKTMEDAMIDPLAMEPDDAAH